MDSDSFFLHLFSVAIVPAAVVVVMITSCFITFIVLGGICMIGYRIIIIFSHVREFVRRRGMVAAGGNNDDDYELIDTRLAFGDQQLDRKYLGAAPTVLAPAAPTAPAGGE
ncbi:hypothetical protein GE21DRAFT_5588 [Neurospora crassa]|uniref:Uncharacterized protein n=1 Tax=Neurospora crassa (strain ATCC 24698 / 74-OR23-1A / CBS 708.71 / DSM 1257 / FGSC 987) TaxID=367110 RepID=Q7S9G8_NEUCR|nr:hypothetical protein NCU06570 [Neurospora crassa OR74A]EAA33041.1 hypothetical protein NCU06570 [Neurospora crassa OR74A]KHE80546.1 hypothetical protein GE21DRAFT_5588 [Neurospora crassa]|eukprot:XP_962277.1 hypothetical protein NCU06570 [Neurospora crassa OR74A]